MWRVLFRGGVDKTRSVRELRGLGVFSSFEFHDVEEGNDLPRAREVVTVTAAGGTSQVRPTAAASSRLEVCNDASYRELCALGMLSDESRWG